MHWWKGLKGKLRFNEPLSRHTSFKIGGSASYFFEPKDVRDLLDCLKKIKKLKIPYLLIGSGTNLLISDKGFKGVVINLSSKPFKYLRRKNNIITISSGATIQNLVNKLSKTRLGGYEFLAGIPGSIAGALVMNAGTTFENKRQNIGDITHKVKIINNKGKIVNLSRSECGFGYRKSNLHRYVIIEAQLKLNNSRAGVTNRINDFLSYRKEHHDYSRPNAGCIFKNPSRKISAGKLIEECGFKGSRIGGAMVSKKHANFILNFNRATADDVVKLMNTIKKRVRNRFRVALKEEIKIVC